jgi:hypothetical protein
MISEEKGIFSVGKIRNKTFEISRFWNGWKAGKKVFKIDKPGKQQSSKVLYRVLF